MNNLLAEQEMCGMMTQLHSHLSTFTDMPIEMS